MTMAISIHGEFRPIAEVILLSKPEEAFIELRLADGALFYLPGYGANCLEAARQLIEQLDQASLELSTALKASHEQESAVQP